MAGDLYLPVFTLATAVLCLFYGLRYCSSNGYGFQQAGSSIWPVLIIALIIVFWVGFRPPLHGAFGDSSVYAGLYSRLDTGDFLWNFEGEWAWAGLNAACKSIGLGIGSFFTVVEAIYVLTAVFAVRKFMPNNPMLGMLFVWSSLMYFTFGVNGLRNGLACHIMLMAIAFILESKYVPGVLLCILAMGFHRSVFLPIAGLVAALTVIRNPKTALWIWLAAIPLSLVAGGSFTNYFMSLGFDDRMTSYATSTEYSELFSSTGFRWDFLIYSATGTLMAWYICVKKQVSDSWYNVICTIYLLANAFWILIIRVSFTNRFAYLSWFLLPIVIAYPLVNLPVWEDQDKMTGLILMAYCAFTVFMNFIYWQ